MAGVGESVPSKKREYDLLPVRLSTPAARALVDGAEEADEKLTKDIRNWLNARGTEGFRLIRAEADSNGWMWLIVERAE